MDPSLRGDKFRVAVTKGTLPPRLTLHFDGACSPRNPGGVATYGWHVSFKGEELAYGYGVVADRSTNNVAEWAALTFGLRWLKKQGWKGQLRLRGDSDLVVMQLSRKWKFRKLHLLPWAEECWKILDEVCPDNWNVKWLPRKENQRGDDLSKKAYRRYVRDFDKYRC